MTLGTTPLYAALASDQWNVTNQDGVTTPLNWFDGANWLNGNIPNDDGSLTSGFTADFSRNPLAVGRQLITLDQEATIGRLLLGDLTGNGSYQFTGVTGVPTINNAMAFAAGAGLPVSIEKRSGGNDVILNDLKIWNTDLDVTVLTSGTSLTLAGRLFSPFSAGINVNKYGGGTLRVTHDLPGPYTDFGVWNTALQSANLGPGSSFKVFAGVLETGNSWYTAPNNETWSSVFGERSAVGIELYGGQLNIRNNGASTPSTAALQINYGNPISIVRDSVINLGQFSAGYTNRIIRFGQLRVGDATVVVNTTNGYSLRLDSLLVQGSAARVFSNQNISVDTMSGDASLNKFGAGTLTITGSTSFTNGINVLQGVVWADHPAATSTARMIVSPNTRFDISYQSSIPGNASRANELYLASSVNSANPGFGVLSLRNASAAAPANAPWSSQPRLDFSVSDWSKLRLGPLGSVIGLNIGSYIFDIDQSKLGNGKNVFIGATGTTTLALPPAATGAAPDPPAFIPWRPSVDGIYRFGANASATTVLTITAPGLFVDRGVGDPSSLMVGMPIARNTQNGTGIAYTTGTVTIDRNQSYSGITTINTGSTISLSRSGVAADVGNRLGTGTTVNILGTLSTTNQNYAPNLALWPTQLTQTVYNIYGGGLFDINNTGLVGTFDHHRIPFSSTLNLVGGQFRFQGDNVSTNRALQAVTTVNSWGQATIDIRRATPGGSDPDNLAQVVFGIVDAYRGSAAGSARSILSFTNTGLVGNSFDDPLSSLILINLNGNALTDNGVSLRPNGMLPVYMVNGSAGQYLMIDGTNRVSDMPTDAYAAFGADSTVSAINAATAPTAGDSVYALRVAANINNGAGSPSLRIRSGGFLASANITAAAPLLFNDGTSDVEAIVYTTATGTTSFTNTITANGLTKGGPGVLNLNPGTNNSNRGNAGLLSGTVTINAGTLQATHQFALGGGDVANPFSTSNVPQVELYGGTFQPNLANTNFLADVTAKSTSTIAPAAANTKFRNLTIDEMPMPLVVDSAGAERSPTAIGTSVTIATNAAFMSGNLVANGPALLTTQQNLVVEGTLQGAGSIDKWGNGTLSLLHGASGYSGAIRVFQGALQLQDGRSVASQLGAGMIDVMPGAIIRLASPSGIAVGAKAVGAQFTPSLTLDVFGTSGSLASVALPASLTDRGLYYHASPKIRVVPTGDTFLNGPEAELVADFDPLTGRISGIRVINGGNYTSGTGAPTVAVEIDAPGASPFEFDLNTQLGGQLAIHSDRAGLGVLSLIYGGQQGLPTGVQFYANNGLYGGVVAIDTVGFTADLNLRTINIHKQDAFESPALFLGSTLGGTYQGFRLTPQGSATATQGFYYLGGGGGLLNINTSALVGRGLTSSAAGSMVYIGANSNLNVFESLSMALGGGNIAFNNVQLHGNTSIQGGGTLTIGIHGALDSTRYNNVLGGIQFNGNTHPVFASSNSAIGLAVLQPSTLLGRSTLNPTLTINNNIYFSGDLGVNTNNGNDVVFTGNVYLGNSLFGTGALGASRFFTIGNVGTPGRVYFRGGISDGVEFSGARDNQVIKQGVGVMHMEGTNTYTGSTHILAGFIALTTDNDIPKALSPGQSIFMQGGGIGVWEAAPTAQTPTTGARDATRRFSDTVIIYPQVAGPYGVANSPNGFGIFDVGAGLRFSQYGGSVSGGGTLIKQGQGTLVLGANQTDDVPTGDAFTIANAITGINVTGGVLQFNTQSSSGDPTQPSAQPVFFTGTTTASSANVTAVGTTTGLAPGMLVTGSNIAVGTKILAITGPTTMTLDRNVLGAATNGSLRVGGFSFQLNSPVTLTNSSNIVTLGGTDTTASLLPGMVLSGTNIPGNATITRILSPTTFEISANTGGAAAGTTTLRVAATNVVGGTSNDTITISLDMEDSLGDLLGGLPISGGSIPTGTLILNRISVDTVTGTATYRLSKQTLVTEGDVNFLIGGIAANLGNGGTTRFNYSNTPATAYSRNMQTSGALGFGIDVSAGNTFYYSGSLLRNDPNLGYMYRKTGAGTLVTSGTNSLSAIEINNGAWRFTRDDLIQTTNGGWGDSARVTIAGGEIQFDGAIGPWSTNLASSVTFSGGGAFNFLNSGVTVAATDLIRSAQGTLLIKTIGSLGGASPVDNRFNPTNTFFNGTNSTSLLAARSSAGIFSAFLLHENSNTNIADFLTADGNGFVVPSAGAFIGNVNLGNEIALGDFTTAQTIADGVTRSMFAFKTTADISGGRISISSVANTAGPSNVGGIIFNGNATISSDLYFNSDPGPLVAVNNPNGNSGEALIYVATNAVGTLTGDIFARGLTKFGGGNLVLAGANEILGNLTVQAGTLTIGATGTGAGRTPLALGTTFATPLVVNSTGTLDLNGVAYSFDSLGTTGGAAGGVITNSRAELGELIINGMGNPTLNIVRTGTAAASTANITGLSSTSDLFIGQSVIGLNVPAGTFITGITNSGAITLSNNVSAAIPAGTPITFGSIYEGRIMGNVKLTKVGLGTLTLGGFTTANPDAGNNTHTGGTEIQGGTLMITNPLNLGGADDTVAGKVELFGGSLRVRINGGNNNGVIVLGNQNTAGVNVDLNASSTIELGNLGANTGNAVQIGDLRLSGATLTLNTFNNYYLKVAGTTRIGDGSSGAWTDLFFNTNNAVIEIAGRLVGDGLIYKRDSAVNGVLRTLVISGTSNGVLGGGGGDNNGFRGNILVAGGALQITGNTGNPIGTGTVTVLPAGQLRVAGNSSLGAGSLKIGSQVNAWAGIGLDGGFNPTFLTNAGAPKTAFGSMYGTLLQITTPFYNQVLNMANVGDGRAFVAPGIAAVGATFEAGLNPTPTTSGNPGMLPGVADSFVAGQPVYRLSGNANLGAALALVGVDNTLQNVGGATFLQIGPIANNFLSVANVGAIVTGTGGNVIFRQANNYTGGTQIVRGQGVILDIGAFGGSALGTGDVEVFGALTLGSGSATGYGGVASFVNPSTGTNYHNIVLRSGGQIFINDVAGDVAGGQGRWADAVPLNLNGGTFAFIQGGGAAVTNGAVSTRSYEKIGDVTASKGGALRVVRAAGAGQAVLEMASLTRADGTGGTNAMDRGTLLITNSAAITGTGAAASATLGVTNLATLQPTNYDRLIVTGGIAALGGLSGTTSNSAQVARPGIAPVWIVDATSNTYVTYNPTDLDGDTGFQPIVSTTSPGFGQVGYARVIGAGALGNLAASGEVIDITGAQTVNVGSSINWYAARVASNITFTAGTPSTITFAGGDSRYGGLLFSAASTISGAAVTNAPNTQSTLAFGAKEAVIYTANGITATINSQITQSAGGLTKFGQGALVLAGSNTLNGTVVVNGGTLQLNNPYSGTGGLINDAVNGQTIVLNGNGVGTGAGQAGTTTLVIDSLLANNAGNRDSLFATSVLRMTRTMASAIHVRGDSTITNNNQAVIQKISSLTVADLGVRSPVTVNFSTAGITVANGVTLGANSNAVNVSFGSTGMVSFDGQVTGGAGGRLFKTGNGMLFLNSGTNSFGSSAAGAIGLEVWASTQNTATSIVGTTFRGTGTPFGVGDINLLPGSMIRLADSANIASQIVNAYSDILGIAGVSFAYHNYDAGNIRGLRQADILNMLTTGTATDGKVRLSTTGNYLGVISLDNGWQYGALDLAAMEAALGNGKIWLGASTSNQIYFAPTLAPNAGNVYRLGGGGNQGSLVIGGNGFENLLTGANNVVAGANDFGFNAVSYINGNFSLTLRTRNNLSAGTTFTAERDTTVNIENAFALGAAKLIVNHASDVSAGTGAGGLLQTSGGNMAINNNVDIYGDLRFNGGNDLTIRGNVNLTPTGFGGTRVIQAGTGGAGILSILGTVSGDRSNLVKSGAGNLMLGGLNTYTGTTQLAGTGGNLLVSRNVLPNTPGPLGNSDSPVLVTAGSATLNAIGLGLSGQVTFGRDVIVQLAAGTLGVSIYGNTNYTSRFTGGIAVGVPLTGTTEVALQSAFGGRFEMLGTITSNTGVGSMRVRIGDTVAATGGRTGTVYFGSGPNGTSLNNYVGNTILDVARIVVGTNSQFAGSGDNIQITSSPFGLGTIQLASTTNGTFIGSDGANREVPNTLATSSVAGNVNWTFEGRGNLTFLSDVSAGWNVNSDGTLRNRSFVVNTSNGFIQFNTDVNASGANGVNLLKTGQGVLVMNGEVSTANRNTGDGNYGTGWFIDAGMLRVTSDLSLGNLGGDLATGAGLHDAGAPADIRLRSASGTTLGGTLSIGGNVTTDRKLILVATSGTAVMAGIEVSAGRTFTLNNSLVVNTGVTAATLVKSGQGTMVLNGASTNITALQIGGVTGGGGTVRTSVSGTPLVSSAASSRVTIAGGTLELLNPGSTYNLAIPRLSYSSGSYLRLSGTGATTLSVTDADVNAFQRLTSGMLTIVADSLGSTKRVLINATAAPLNTANQILAIPSVVTRTIGGTDLNFVKYDATNGFMTHNMPSQSGGNINTFNGLNSGMVAEFNPGAPILGPAAATTMYALRTNNNIGIGATMTITSGGLIMNGPGLIIDAPIVFGASASTPGEALVWVSDPAASSQISGRFTALNFTKAGPGTLVLANNTGINSAMVPLSDAGRTVTVSGNQITGDTRDLSIGMAVTGAGYAAGTVITDILSVGASGVFTTSSSTTSTGSQSITISGLRRVTVQEGILKFANQSAIPQTVNGASSVVMAIGDVGTFDVNGQQLTIGGLVGTGSITNSVSSTLARLTVNVDASQAQSTGMVFSGSISGNLEFVKSGIGTLVISSPINADGATYVNTFTGGTFVDAGQIIGAHNFAPSALGTLAIRTVNALGTGKITLRGGTLDLSMTGTGSSGYTANQIIDGFNVIQVGSGDGYDIDVAATTNFGAASPNTTSALAVSLASPTAWSKINNVNFYGRALTWAGGQNTNVLVAGRFDASVSTASRIFLNTVNAGAITGQLYAPGKTLVKAGAQTLFLTNTSTTAPNIVGGWEIYAGTLELRQSDGGSSPLGGDTSILLNGATFNIRLEGDNTNTMQMLRTFAGNSIVVGSSDGIGTATYAGIGAAVISTDRLGGGANKTVVLKDLTYGGPVGSAMLTHNTGNAYSLQFTNLFMDGRDAYMTANGNLTIAGTVTSNTINAALGTKLANGTLVKQGSGNLFINGDNTSTFRGGTVITAGTIFFGKFEGVMTSLSDSPNSVDDTPGDPSDDLRANSNLGEGHVLVNPGAAIQFNSLQNRVANWAGMVDLRGNLMNNYGMLRLAVNAPLSDFNVRFGNLGGVQDGTFFNLLGGTGYRGVGKNNGSAIIALNTVYTQTLNMARLGDGTAFLGSTTNGVGLNGSYNAATLGVGTGNLYRLGAGGSTLYIAADMANANILTGTAGLVVGMPQSSINNDNLAGGNGRGIVVLMTPNNYTGATTVNRGSTLEFRGGMGTSSFTSWGTLTAAGLGGTFLNDAGTFNRITPVLMPSSELRFDNSSGLLPNTAAFAQGRWADDVAVILKSNVLRLIGNRDAEVTETVGNMTLGGGNQIIVQRDYASRRVTLIIRGGALTDLSQVTNSAINGLAITGNNGTLQINPATAGQLGSDERVMLFSGLSGGITITNGMVAPWIINATENQFLTYTAENGFINAGFNSTRSGAFGTTPVSTPTDRTQITAAASMAGAGGLILDTYALRLDNSFTFAVNTTAEAGDRLRIRSGALIVNGAFSIIPGLEFGAGSATQAYIYNNNTLVIGSASTAAASTTVAGVSPTTTGQITGASHIIKSGAGQLQIDAPQPGFTGNWIVNQGNIMFRSATSAPTTLGGAADGSLRATGAGGWVVFNGHDSQLLLRGDQTNTTFNVGLALAYGVTQARISADRALSTSTTGLAMVVAGGIRMGGSPGEQGQTLVFGGGNSYTLTVNGTVNLGPTTLDGSPAFAFLRTEVPTVLNGLVTGGGVLVKTGGSNLDLTNVTAGLNDFGALQIIQGGTLTVRAYAPVATPPLAYAAGVNNVITNGGLGNGTVTLWGGALALLYDVGSNDATRQRFWIGNGSTGNSLVVNGSANITVNRNAATRDGNPTATTTKQLAFRDMTIGSQTLTIANGNSYYLEINGKTNLVATPVLNTGSPLVLFGGVDDGGSRAAIVKMGGSELWINAASSFGGLFQGALGANGIGLVVNGGLVRFGDGVTDGGVATSLNTIMRGSTMRVNPTGNVYITNPTNVTFGAGQLQMLGSAPQLPVFRLANAGFSQTYLQNALSGDSQAVLGMEATFAASFALDLATIGNGRSFLAAQGATRTYSATSLGVGADGIYRLGGLGQALSVTTGVLVGAGNKLQVGSQATNVAGTVILGAQNTYTGGTIVSRSNVLQFSVAANATGHALGTGQVDVFGTLLQTSNGTFFANGSTTTHQNTIVLHPGSTLRMDLGTTGGNRWGDSIPINLDGAMLQVTTGAANMNETVGDVAFHRHGQVFLNGNAGGQAQVTVNGTLTRASAGATLLLSTTAVNTLGSAATAGNRLLVSGGAGQITGGSLVNGMLPAYYVNATDNTFVTYGANGFANFTGYTTVAGGDLAATTINASTVLNVNTTGSNPLNLVGDLTLYALRTNQSILSGAGQYNRITFSGNDDVNRGGIISQNLAVVLGVDLQFGDNGDREGIIYVNNNTLTIQGDVYAGSMTKFGSNTLIMAKDQTADARGSGGGFTGAWTVNQGNLQLNTFGASGTGPITLNPSSPNTATGTTLLLRAIPGSALNGQYTMGKITMVDNAIVDVNANAADTTVSVNDLDVYSSDTTGLSPARARFVMNQQRSILGVNTLTLTGTGASIIDVNATALNNVITAGVSAGVTVNALGTSANDLIKWGNGVLYLRGNNTSYTGNVYVEQGVLSVTTPGALTSAASITVRRYGALEIFTAGFNRAVTYEAGSVERWSAEGARNGAVNLGAATLQVANDQFSTTAQVTLNGGSIEGFLRADDVLAANNSAVYRTLGANVSFILAGNSFVGQDPLFGGPNGLNNGRTPDYNANGVGTVGSDLNTSSNLTESVRGVILEIKGNITESGGARSLSKQSLDTVILSGSNSYTGGTNIGGGTLRITSAGGLAPGSDVRMYGPSILDISVDDTTAESSVPVVSAKGLISAKVSGEFVSSAGFITNSSTRVNTLRIGAAAVAGTSTSFGGVIQNNLNLQKLGPHQQVLTGANTYFGYTYIAGGTLTVDGSIAGSGVTVASGGRLNGGVVGTPGVVSSPIVVQSGAHYSAGSNTFNADTGNGVGQMNVTAGGQAMQWDAGAEFTFDFNAMPTGGAVAGTNWDYVNIVGGSLKINATVTNSINVFVDAWNTANTAYGQNNLSSTPGGSYSWLWVTASDFVNSSNTSIADGTVDFFNVQGNGPTGVFSPSGGNYSGVVGSNFWVTRQGTGLYVNFSFTAVPEPSSLLLIGVAGLGFAGYRRRRKQQVDVDQSAELDQPASSSEE